MAFAGFDPAYITVHEQGDVVIVAATMARLTDDENIEQMGQELFALVDQFGCRKLVVDLHNVELITSAVLGKLITLHRRLHRVAGQLIICRVSDDVSDVLRSSRLVTYFNIADDLDGALAALS